MLISREQNPFLFQNIKLKTVNASSTCVAKHTQFFHLSQVSQLTALLPSCLLCDHTLITSRLSRLFQRELGSSERVTSSSEICSGDLNDGIVSVPASSSSWSLSSSGVMAAKQKKRVFIAIITTLC